MNKLARIYLMPGVAYDIKVRGVQGGSRGAWSSTIQYTTTGSGDPLPPSGLVVMGMGDGILAAWARPADKDVSYYLLYSDADTITVDVDGKVPESYNYIASATEYVWLPYTFIYGATTLHFRVEAVGKNGNRSTATTDESCATGPGYEAPLTFTAPLSRTGDTVSIDPAGVVVDVKLVVEAYELNPVTDFAVVFDATISAMATLPAATGAGTLFAIKNLNESEVTISATGSTIDGADTVQLVQWGAVQLLDYDVGCWAKF